MEIIKDNFVVAEDCKRYTEIPINMTEDELTTFRKVVGVEYDMETEPLKSVSEVVVKRLCEPSVDKNVSDLIAKFGLQSLINFANSTMKIGCNVSGDATCIVTVNVKVEDEHLESYDIDITDKDAIQEYLDGLTINPDIDDGHSSEWMDSYEDSSSWEDPQWFVYFRCRPICVDA